MIIKLVFAFGAGFISFLTPCVLPIIPGYISYITGKNLNEIEQDKKNVLIFKRVFLSWNLLLMNKVNLEKAKWTKTILKAIPSKAW